MKILGTGLAGLVGSRITELLSSDTFENISRATGVDITHKEDVFTAIGNTDASIVLHLAAKADVDGCEKDKIHGNEGEAWKVNVEGTRNIATACEQFGKKLLYVSTDFVFDGEKEFYTEDDTPHPLNWYAQTKYEGEKIVASLSTPWIIARIAYPYRAFFTKNDFVRAIKNKLDRKEKLTLVTDHIMTPTFVDDIAYAFQKLWEMDMNGIYHVVGSQYLSPFDAAVCIAQIFGYEVHNLEKTTRDVYFANRAKRPFHLAIKNDNIRKLGIEMSTFEAGIGHIKQQV